MLFNSYPFLLIFLPLTVLVFYGLRHFGWLGASVASLTLASIAFYAYWKPQDTVILLGSIVFNYFVSKGMVQAAGLRSRLLLVAGVCGNLGVLFYFKYFNFVAANLAALTGLQYTLRAIVLPIGISFFTFTQIAYLVDCFRSRKNEPNIVNYGLFVTIFPHLIAGPIIHHAQMRPQFDALRRAPVDPEMIKMGIVIFIIGLAKKVLLADNLVVGADLVFNAADHGSAPGFSAAWMGVISYTLQIYFDFSGYCDMAIGLALLFGLRLPVNFDSPYKSRSIIEFWRRWHMTLSAWLRDYLYIPLGGNRHGELMRLRNIFITMLLGGIWHGAGWTFVIWGALHGTYIVANHAWLLWRPQPTSPADRSDRLVLAGKQALTVLVVMFAWVFFRAKSVAGALLVVRSMAAGGTPSADPLIVSPFLYFWIALGSLIALFAPNSQQLTRYTQKLTETLKLAPSSTLKGFLSGGAALAATPATAVVLGLLFAVAFAQLWRPAIFIYFNF
jgi:D-alanyl-lipoteichoic acid acyltransferase DltB (MBOAT superfamily)